VFAIFAAQALHSRHRARVVIVGFPVAFFIGLGISFGFH